jgi:hypothetical protein
MSFLMRSVSTASPPSSRIFVLRAVMDSPDSVFTLRHGPPFGQPFRQASGALKS